MIVVMPLISCGQGSPFYDDVLTGAPPTVVRIDPISGAAGSKVTIYGLGFSYLAPTNVVTMGDKAVSADDYSILANPSNGEIESITFTVAADIPEGEYPVVVVVHDTPSNADITFTVTP